MIELVNFTGVVHYSRPDDHPDVEKWRRWIADGTINGFTTREIPDGVNTCLTI